MSAFRPAAVIQHHSARAALLPRLTGSLDQAGLRYEVVEDDPDGRPSPWRGYRACLTRATKLDATHVLIVQDDAELCFDFACWLECRVRQEPDVPLVLFMAAQPRLTATASARAAKDGASFVPLHPRDFMPAVAISWPVDVARDVAAWADTYTGRHTRSDDHMLGEWHRATNTRVLVTIPSLVQHPDDVPSLIGNGGGSHGRNPARTALHWDG